MKTTPNCPASSGSSPSPCSPSSDYVPYGPEWEAEITRLPKNHLVPMLRKALLAKQSAVDAVGNCPEKTADEKWRDYFVLPIAQEMKRRGIGEMRITLTKKGTAVFELLPENDKATNHPPRKTKL